MELTVLSVPGSAEEFNYTRMGGNTVIEGVDDRADMAETQKTFTLLGKGCHASQGDAHSGNIRTGLGGRVGGAVMCTRAALREDPGLSPSTQVAAHSHLQLQEQVNSFVF